MTEVAREQAARLSAVEGVETLRVPAAVLLAGGGVEETRATGAGTRVGRGCAGAAGVRCAVDL